MARPRARLAGRPRPAAQPRSPLRGLALVAAPCSPSALVATAGVRPRRGERGPLRTSSGSLLSTRGAEGPAPRNPVSKTELAFISSRPRCSQHFPLALSTVSSTPSPRVLMSAH